MKRSIKVGVVLFLSLLIWFNSYAYATGTQWQDYVDYVMLMSDHYEKDYSRAQPPYERHIKLIFLFENMTKNRRIAAIEFTTRFFDMFGDLVHETEKLKRVGDLSPGEWLDMDSFHYYKDPWPKEGPYNKIAPLVKADGLINTEVAVHRIAFRDGEVLVFEDSEWVETRVLREERQWKPAFISWREKTGTVETQTFSVTTKKWKVSFLVFSPPAECALTIDIYTADDCLVKSKTFKLEESVNIGEIELTGAEKYYLNIIGDKGVKWTVHIHESF